MSKATCSTYPIFFSVLYVEPLCCYDSEIQVTSDVKTANDIVDHDINFGLLLLRLLLLFCGFASSLLFVQLLVLNVNSGYYPFLLSSTLWYIRPLQMFLENPTITREELPGVGLKGQKHHLNTIFGHNPGIA